MAVALLNVSNPDIRAMDALSRLSHDADPDVAQAAILSLGDCALHLQSHQAILLPILFVSNSHVQAITHSFMPVTLRPAQLCT